MWRVRSGIFKSRRSVKVIRHFGSNPRWLTIYTCLFLKCACAACVAASRFVRWFAKPRSNPGDLIYPLFICPGEGVRNRVSSMPGVFNLSVDEAVREAEEAASLGIGGLLLFGLPDSKDERAPAPGTTTASFSRAFARSSKTAASKKLVLIADVCLCEYTSHGHCGVVIQDQRRRLRSRQRSLARIARPHRCQPRPCRRRYRCPQRHDGWPRCRHSRSSRCDGNARHPILSYASKFASAFYGPFREAADSAPQFGDRRSYQMDGANLREAMREIDLDLEEGADMILMKPAMPYLDVVHAAREKFDVPIGAYQVSGEYSMLHAAFQRGWLERDRTMLESLIGIRRAGADFIVTYFAKDAAKLLSASRRLFAHAAIGLCASRSQGEFSRSAIIPVPWDSQRNFKKGKHRTHDTLAII